MRGTAVPAGWLLPAGAVCVEVPGAGPEPVAGADDPLDPELPILGAEEVDPELEPDEVLPDDVVVEPRGTACA
jgi:hypothetical protein